MLGLWQVFVGMAESLVPESGSEGATSKAKVAWQGLELRAWVNLKGFLWILWIIMGTFHFLGIQKRLCEIVVQVDAIGIHVFTCYAAGLKYHLDRYRVFGT